MTQESGSHFLNAWRALKIFAMVHRQFFRGNLRAAIRTHLHRGDGLVAFQRRSQKEFLQIQPVPANIVPRSRRSEPPRSREDCSKTCVSAQGCPWSREPAETLHLLPWKLNRNRSRDRSVQWIPKLARADEMKHD